MKEAYVKFGTAQLLKQKGFDWECCNHFYCRKEDGKVIERWMLFPADRNSDRWVNKYAEYISAPTQQMACKWLREVHKIDISVTPDDGSWWIKVTELEYWSGVFNGKVLNSDDIKYAYKGDTSAKESCYEAALQYVLTELI